MYELSLFTGAGGGCYASKLLGHKLVGYVEIDEFCQRLITRRVKDGIFDNAPIFSNIETFISSGYAASYQGVVDIISGGFPCQPFSTASRGRRVARDFWPEMRRVCEIIRPRWVFGENVSRKAVEVVSTDLRDIGYSKSEILCLRASNMGGPHIRGRYWVLSYSDESCQSDGEVHVETCGMPPLGEGFWRNTDPRSIRISDGLAGRRKQLAALGNGQVPIVAAVAFCILKNRILKCATT